MYIMTELYENLVILKIGYTFNIINRYKSLMTINVILY